MAARCKCAAEIPERDAIGRINADGTSEVDCGSLEIAHMREPVAEFDPRGGLARLEGRSLPERHRGAFRLTRRQSSEAEIDGDRGQRSATQQRRQESGGPLRIPGLKLGNRKEVTRVDEVREESQCPPVVRCGTDQIGRQMYLVTSTKQREGLVSP